MTTKPVIYVIYYSMFNHIATLGDSIVEGMLKNDDVEVKTFRVQETLSEEVLDKMHAPPSREKVPIITVDELPKADAFLFGLPTRFGTPPAQFKTFWDSTGQLWQKGELNGKMAGTFFSSASQSGGQESTAWTLLPNLVHHQLIYVPLGYSKVFNQLNNNTEVSGGSAYGAGTIAGGDGSRKPSANEIEIAHAHGEYFAGVVAQFYKGKANLEAIAAANAASNAITTDAAVGESSTGAIADTQQEHAKHEEPATEVPATTTTAVNNATGASAPEKKESKIKRMMKRISRIF